MNSVLFLTFVLVRLCKTPVAGEGALVYPPLGFNELSDAKVTKVFVSAILFRRKF